MPRSLFLLFALLLAACSSVPKPDPDQLPPLPPAPTTQAALDRAQADLSALRSLSASARITLTRSDGQSVTLDGAIVFLPADRKLRLRAWKFDQPVFDLTSTPQGTWLWTDPGHQDHANKNTFDQITTAGMARFFDRLDDLKTQPWTYDFGSADIIGAHHGSTFLRINAVTQTLRKLVWAVDPNHMSSLELQRYRAARNVRYPTHIHGFSTDSGSYGSFDILLQDEEINAPVADGAFTPPPDAVKTDRPAAPK